MASIDCKNGKRGRTHSAFSREEIADALEHTVPYMAEPEVTVNLVAERLAADFGVTVNEIKDGHRNFLRSRIPQLVQLRLPAADSQTPGDSRSSGEGISTNTRPLTTAQTVANRPQKVATAPKQPKEEATKRATFYANTAVMAQTHRATALPTQQPIARPKLTTRAVKETEPAKHAKTEPTNATETDPAKPTASAKSKKPRASALSTRALTNLTEMAKVVGLLSPRSKLKRSLNEAKTSVRKDMLLRSALDAARAVFKGPYPTKVEIRECKDAQDRLKELQDMDVANILPATTTQRRANTKKPRVSDPPVWERADPLGAFLDEEEKIDDDSDASVPSIRSLSD